MFYAKPIHGNDTFYTCRKFFGVPDGAYLYTDKLLDEEFSKNNFIDFVTDIKPGDSVHKYHDA